MNTPESTQEQLLSLSKYIGTIILGRREMKDGEPSSPPTSATPRTEDARREHFLQFGSHTFCHYRWMEKIETELATVTRELAEAKNERDQYRSMRDTAREHAVQAEKERDELAAWKESAISVMPPMQEIGQALNLILGSSIHDKILSGILALHTRLDALETALNEIANHCDYHADGAPDATPRDRFANEILEIVKQAINSR